MTDAETVARAREVLTKLFALEDECWHKYKRLHENSSYNEGASDAYGNAAVLLRDALEGEKSDA